MPLPQNTSSLSTAILSWKSFMTWSLPSSIPSLLPHTCSTPAAMFGSHMPFVLMRHLLSITAVIRSSLILYTHIQIYLPTGSKQKTRLRICLLSKRYKSERRVHSVKHFNVIRVIFKADISLILYVVISGPNSGFG